MDKLIDYWISMLVIKSKVIHKIANGYEEKGSTGIKCNKMTCNQCE